MKKFIVSAAIAAVFTFYAPAKSADNDPPCLTREQARAKYPGQWLYWRTERRCWYGSGSSKRAYAGSRVVKSKPPPVDNEVRLQTAAVMSPPQPSVYYPTLMAGGGTSNGMLAPWSMTTWPLVTDFDVEPPAFLPWRRIDTLIK